jgi:hypothetical protein
LALDPNFAMFGWSPEEAVWEAPGESALQVVQPGQEATAVMATTGALVMEAEEVTGAKVETPEGAEAAVAVPSPVFISSPMETRTEKATETRSSSSTTSIPFRLLVVVEKGDSPRLPLAKTALRAQQ